MKKKKKKLMISASQSHEREYNIQPTELKNIKYQKVKSIESLSSEKKGKIADPVN